MHVVTSVALHLERIAAAATLAVHNADLRSLLPQVVGGKMTESGRLCAFITKVRKGSLADTVGHLRPGMENTNSLTLTCISLCMNVYIKRFTADSTEKKKIFLMSLLPQVTRCWSGMGSFYKEPHSKKFTISF